jgi:hypothetical protein
VHFPQSTIAESIECFVEDQTFSVSYDLAPPPSPDSKLSLSQSSSLCRRSSLLTGEGMRDWVGEEVNYTTARKSGPL